MGALDHSWVSKAAPFATFAAGGALLIVIAGAVNVPSVPAPFRSGQNAPELVVTRVERLPARGALRERLQLFDPSPLFMPGVGALDADGAATLEQPEGGVGSLIPPSLKFSNTSPARDILRPRPPTTPLMASDRLAATRWFDGLARQDDAAGSDAVAVRVARVEIYRLGEKEPLAAMDLAKAQGLGDATWRPLTLTVLVDVAGVVAQPVVATSSGVDEIDERIRWIVGRELLPRLPLRPGFYRLEVGP